MPEHDENEAGEPQTLQPLNIAPDPRKKKPGRATKKGERRPRLQTTTRAVVSRQLVQAWRQGVFVSERELNDYIPSDTAVMVGEALLSGQLFMPAIIEYTGQDQAKVRAVVTDPVAMAWISRQIHEHFKHRVALIDAALFTRAMGGDVPAIKLWYERHGALVSQTVHHHKHTIGLDPSTLATEDLHRIVTDNARLLANTTRIIDIRPVVETGAGGDIPGAEGAPAPVPGGAAPVLRGDGQETPEAGAVPYGAAPAVEEVQAVCRGEPVGENNGGAP